MRGLFHQLMARWALIDNLSYDASQMNWVHFMVTDTLICGYFSDVICSMRWWWKVALRLWSMARKKRRHWRTYLQLLLWRLHMELRSDQDLAPELFPVRYSNCLRASHYAYLCYLIVLDQCLLFMLLGVVSFQGLNFRPCHIKKS
jgi:hypothetical protein